MPNKANPIINLNSLARQTGASTSEVRKAGVALFEQLAGHEPDLTKALVDAASTSGLPPKRVHAILSAIAEDFRTSLPQAADQGMGGTFSALQGKVNEGLAATSERVSEAIGSVDLEALKERGRVQVQELRGRVAAVDVSELGEKARDAGTALIEGAQSLAKSVVASASQIRDRKQGKNDD